MSDCETHVLGLIDKASFDGRLAKLIAKRHQLVFREDDPAEVQRIKNEVFDLCRSKLNKHIAAVICAESDVVSHELHRPANRQTVLKPSDELTGLIAAFIREAQPAWRRARVRKRLTGVLNTVLFHIGRDIYNARYA